MNRHLERTWAAYHKKLSKLDKIGIKNGIRFYENSKTYWVASWYYLITCMVATLSLTFSGSIHSGVPQSITLATLDFFCPWEALRDLDQLCKSLCVACAMAHSCQHLLPQNLLPQLATSLITGKLPFLVNQQVTYLIFFVRADTQAINIHSFFCLHSFSLSLSLFFVNINHHT